MNPAKTAVRELVDKLPEDCTLEDVQYHLYMVEKVQRGRDAPGGSGKAA